MLSRWMFVVGINIVLQVANVMTQHIHDECPPPESILGCSCKIVETGSDSPGTALEVSCLKLQTEKKLKEVLEPLSVYFLKKLRVSNLNANTFPVDLFFPLLLKNLVLEKVEVEDASFRRGQRHFQGLEGSLETLEIDNSFRNGHRPLINLALDHLEHLQVVILENNQIPEVGDDWFPSGPKGLYALMLERNGIETLGQNAFASLENLKLLAVAGNHLNTMTRSMLPASATRLKHLDFSNNKLNSLPKDLFSGMPNLEEVRLSGNLIRSLDAAVWTNVLPQLKELFLEENPLDCGEEMSWICEYKTNIIRGQCASPPDKRGYTLHKFCGTFL